MTCILVVDDDEATTTLLEMALTRQGYTVTKSNDGAEALQLIQKQPPDLILLDIMMPNMNGIQVCTAIRANPLIAHIPVIMLTAIAEVDNKVAAFNAGADDYVTKPVHLDELKSRVHTLLARQTHSAKPSVKPTVKHVGKVVSVLGVSGGVGASTVALNLAASILQSQPDQVIAELAPGMGKLALQLGLRHQRSIESLSNLSDIGLSSEQVRQTVLLHPTGLHILPATQDPRQSLGTGALRISSVEYIIRNLVQTYQLVFLDLGQGYNSRVRAACALSNVILLVARAEESSLKMAIQQAQLIRGIGVPEDRIYTVSVAFHAHSDVLSLQQVKAIFNQANARYNMLFYFPPMAELISVADAKNSPVVLLEPQGARLRQYLQPLLEKVLARS